VIDDWPSYQRVVRGFHRRRWLFRTMHIGARVGVVRTVSARSQPAKQSSDSIPSNAYNHPAALGGCTTMTNNGATQKSEFLAYEGDQWFARNRSALGAPSTLRGFLVNRLAANLPPQGRPRVLEIGCAGGANLAALAELRDVDAYGVDPSQAAVDYGRHQYPGLSLQVGSADAIPFDDHNFDAILFGFCLYLVDRSLLFRCITEADRLLVAGGTLAIMDFDPPAPSARKYVHRSGIMSYKMDHSQLFTAHPAYVLAEKHALSHHGLSWHRDPEERVALWLLRKDPDHAFQISHGR
jgi:SAM-dependent methyltransferase